MWSFSARLPRARQKALTSRCRNKRVHDDQHCRRRWNHFYRWHRYQQRRWFPLWHLRCIPIKTAPHLDRGWHDHRPGTAESDTDLQHGCYRRELAVLDHELHGNSLGADRSQGRLEHLWQNGGDRHIDGAGLRGSRLGVGTGYQRRQLPLGCGLRCGLARWADHVPHEVESFDEAVDDLVGLSEPSAGLGWQQGCLGLRICLARRLPVRSRQCQRASIQIHSAKRVWPQSEPPGYLHHNGYHGHSCRCCKVFDGCLK